jgi:hypothetical protein
MCYNTLFVCMAKTTNSRFKGISEKSHNFTQPLLRHQIYEASGWRTLRRSPQGPRLIVARTSTEWTQRSRV